MVDHLTFRCIDGGASDATFLSDDDRILLFTMSPDGQLDLDTRRLPANRPDAKPQTFKPARKDWSNQELANLFRVKRLLDTAGIVCEIDRGASDEGDPWFVFCRPDGDVFAHFCRIDGIYILDSPTIDRPLRGRDFNELINDFTGLTRTATGASVDEDDSHAHRVVRFVGNSKVHLHPSAILAALIWTFLLASEDLLLVRVANDGGDDRDPLDIGAVTGDDDIGLVAVETVASLTDVEILELEAFRQDGAKASPKDFGEAEAIEKAAQVHQSGVLVQNHTALGLSTLAIAMGFLSEAIFSDENQAILAALDDLSILDAVVPSDGAQGPDGQIATSGINAFAGEGDGGLDGKTDLSALKASDNDGQAQHKDKTMLESSFKLAVDSSLETVLFTDQAIQLDPFKLVKAAKVGHTEDAAEAHVSATLHANAEPSIHVDTSRYLEFDVVLQGLTAAWKPELREYVIDDVTIKSTFDVTSSVYSENAVLDQLLSDAIDDAIADVSTTPTGVFSVETYGSANGYFAAFDDSAREYIDYVIAKTSSIDIVSVEDHLILIDLDVLEHPSEQKSVMTWTFNDGGTISLIGLQSDYDSYGMLA